MRGLKKTGVSGANLIIVDACTVYELIIIDGFLCVVCGLLKFEGMRCCPELFIPYGIMNPEDRNSLSDT